MKWKKLSSKKIFEHSRLSIYEDEVELPSGHKTTYVHLGSMPDAAMIIGIRKDGKILLQTEYSYPPDEVLLQFPGGLLQPQDTPLRGAKREFAEEAGLSGKLRKIGWFYPDNRRKSHKMHVFIATDLQKAFAKMDPEEAFEDHWFSEAEINQLIKAGKLVNHTALAAWSIYTNSVI